MYRAPSDAFVAWLEASSRGEGAATVEPSSEPAEYGCNPLVTGKFVELV